MNDRRLLAAIAASIIGLLWVRAAPAGPGSTGGLPAPAAGETVIILHGLGRSERSMSKLAEALARTGYEIHNLGYASTDAPPETLLADLDNRIRDCCMTASRLHFVGHSLGGILARAWIARHRPPNLGRLVMLAPPNQGSTLADRFHDRWPMSAIMGPALEALGTEAMSLPNTLPPPDYPVGIIAGTGTINPLGTLLIPGEDDGIISICATRLEGAADYLIVNDSHALIMRSREVIENTAAFLATGRFLHTEPDAVPECPPAPPDSPDEAAAPPEGSG
jgi:pimeloyl-ACP methyl ester carboxylesterase